MIEPAIAVTLSPRPGVIRRIVAGIGSSTLTQVIASLQAVAVVPFFIRAWGEDGYGKWLTLAAAVSYLSLLDFGGQSYTGNLLAMHAARGEMESFRRRLAESISVFSFLSIGALSFVFLLLWAFSWYPLPGLGRTLRRGETVVVGLLACAQLLGVPGGVYGTVYRATGEFARGAMIGNVVRILGMPVTVVLLLVAVDQTIYAVALVALTVIGMTAVIVDTRSRIAACRGVRITFRDAGAGSRDLHQSVYFWLISIVQSALQQGVLLLLALLTSPATVALYVTHRTVANVSGYVGALVQAPLAPEMSFLWAQGRRAALTRLTVVTVRTVMVSTGLIALFLWTTGPMLYPYWTGGRLAFTPLLLAVLLIQAVLAASWNPSSWSMLSTNHHRPIALCYLANLMLTLVTAVWLIPIYGASGAAMAGLTADVLIGVGVLPLVVARFLGISVRQIYRELGLNLLALSSVAAGVLLVGRMVGDWRAPALIVCIALIPLLAFRFFASADWGMPGDVRKLSIRR